MYMNYFYLLPFITYWVTVLLVECYHLLKEDKINRKYRLNKVGEKEVFLNSLGSTIFMVFINYFVDYYNITCKDTFRIYYIFLGIWMIDTIEYFYHYTLHRVPFLYQHIHKVHHQLYAPYSYGALYSHALEGLIEFLLILGGYVTFNFSHQEMIIVTSLANIAAVLDHSNIRLWKNNFHELHHSKYPNYNFQVPFFTYYDRLFGTYKE